MKKLIVTFLFFGFMAAASYADDTEIYLGDPDAQTVNPNVLFIFDTSGSMGNSVTYCEKYGEVTERVCVEPGRWGRCNKHEDQTTTKCLRSTTKTRLAITQEAAKKTINNLSGINLALMQFNDKAPSSRDPHHGGYMDLPMKSIDEQTHRNNVVDKINSYRATTWTPLVESVHEAYLYMTGGNVKHAKACVGSGRGGCTNQIVSHPETFTGSVNNAKYKSPIMEECQKNHIVLFTDGASTKDGDSDADIQALMRNYFSTSDLAGTGLSRTCTTNSGTTEGNNATTSCLRNLAYIMNNTDASDSLDGMQTIQFHAIGGFIGGNLQTTLDAAAEYGGGISANAQNPEELETALTKIFDNILQSAGTFAAPSVAVNAFNSLEQLDQVYYSVFKPHEAVGWSGNVKRYRMDGDRIVDADNNDAVDDSTGFFKDSARSFWSQTADGDNVTAGGMASRLQDDRKVVSNIVSNDLMHANNRIRKSNNNITRELLGTTLRDANFEGPDVDPSIDSGYTDSYTTAEFTKLVNWVGGLKAQEGSTESRRSMEDPLHSTPVLLNYGELTIDGKKVPDSTLFVGTNSGYLHAFDTNENNPKERFAFIPKELLPVATRYYEGVGKKKYGLDGPISVWHDDKNNNKIIDSNEKAYLYVGMRRGGSSYYALDVSNRDNPKLLWQINGKNHQNGPTPGFEELGQTWSKMVPIDIKWNGDKKKALVFGGGYDIAEDTTFTRQAHSVGNAIYIVDAETGNLLWKASSTSSADLKLSAMTSAIPSNVVAVDDSSDGYVDLLYVADLGGRIWRVDLNNEAANASDYATGGMVADLGKDSSQGEHVRFYESLDVVYSREFSYVDAANQPYSTRPRYMLSVGSGYRAHPLDTAARDNFYVLFDYNVDGPKRDSSGKAKYEHVTKEDLQKYAFSNGDLDITPTTKSNNGFYVELIDAGAKGEKVLSSSITLNNTIYFTSFRPSDGVAANSCSSDTGSSRLYRISLREGGDSEGAVEEIEIPGIAPRPVVVLPNIDPDCRDCDERNPQLLISTKIIDVEDGRFPLKKTFWREMER